MLTHPIKASLVAVGALILGSLSAPVPAAAEQLVIYHALDFAESAAKAFTAKTGNDVKLVELGTTGEMLGKISAAGDNTQFDLV